MAEYKKVELGEELPGCKPDDETGFPTLHAWTHDGLIWDMPQKVGEPKKPPTEFPFLWSCSRCGMLIRTRKLIPGFAYPEQPGFDNAESHP